MVYLTRILDRVRTLFARAWSVLNSKLFSGLFAVTLLMLITVNGPVPSFIYAPTVACVSKAVLIEHTEANLVSSISRAATIHRLAGRCVVLSPREIKISARDETTATFESRTGRNLVVFSESIRQ